MLKLPEELARQMQPMPKDFAPEFEELKRAVRWRTTLRPPGEPPLLIELGYSRSGDDAVERARLRAAAWQALELARLGHHGRLSHARADRHGKSRPISKPGQFVFASPVPDKAN